MDIEKTIKSLKRNGYKVSYFETANEVVNYLSGIEGQTIGFGGSRTLQDLNLKEILSKKNTVYDPDHPDDGENFPSTALKAMTADLFFLSANAISENGEIVNMDATGNRLAGSLFGHKKVFYVVSTAKIEPNLEKAVWRVRNIAAPANCRRFNLKTPCNLKGDGCHDCRSPQRICAKMLISFNAGNSPQPEIILFNEPYGFYE